jgi:hypothetical protein
VLGPVEVGRTARAATDAPGRSPADRAGLLAYAS